MENKRYQQGCETLQKLTGDASEKVVKGIESFSPEFGKINSDLNKKTEGKTILLFF